MKRKRQCLLEDSKTDKYILHICIFQFQKIINRIIFISFQYNDDLTFSLSVLCELKEEIFKNNILWLCLVIDSGHSIYMCVIEIKMIRS